MYRPSLLCGVALALVVAACGDNIKPDDETGTGLLEITPAEGLETSESAGTATFTVVMRSRPPGNMAVVQLSTSDADEGLVEPSTLTFTNANYDEPQTVTVTGVDDDVDDGDQSFTVDVDADAAGRGVVTVTNTDDDTAAVTVTPTDIETSEDGTTASFTVVLGSQPSGDVTIALTSGDTGEGTLSTDALVFTAADWNAARTVTVTGVDDDSADGNIDYTVTVAAATSSDTQYAGKDGADVSVTNLDNDTANFIVTPTTDVQTTEGSTTAATFTVRLATQPTADVTIDVTSGDETEGTVSDATLTFTPVNWNAPQTVSVTSVDDNAIDGDITYTITLDNVVTTDALYTTRDPSDVTVTNLDNDSANIAVSRTSGLVTDETGLTDTFTIVLLSQPSADVVISYQSDAVDEADVSPTSPITFTPADWNVPKTISAVGVDDLTVDGPQPFTITMTATSADLDYDGLAIDAVSGSNLDNDVPAIRVTPLRIDVAEFSNDPGDTFEVVLLRAPVGTVTIPLTVSDTTEASIDKSSLTFTTLNWNVPQVVTVDGLDDALIDGQQQFQIITEPVVSTDPSYAGLDADDVTVFNFDDESPGVYLQGKNLLKTLEGVNQPQFVRMRLTIAPTAPVTCVVRSSDESEVTFSPTTFTFDASNFSTLQTITVRGVDDSDADGDQLVQLITEPCTSADPLYNLFDPRDLEVLNRDNEP